MVWCAERYHPGMSARPVVEVCANCGAPLELDQDGKCRWCHGRIRVDPPPSRRDAPRESQLGLVPDGVDDCWTSAPFIYLMLSVLGAGLSTDAVVQNYIRKDPALHQQIRALSVAVSAAGVRVRDASLLKSDLDDNLKVYTPEEIWIFNLALDVIGMLGAVDGLSGSTRALIKDDLRQLDQDTNNHTWKKELKRAGEGPEAFRHLRAKTPLRPR
jgi:hypothetical protein